MVLYKSLLLIEDDKDDQDFFLEIIESIDTTIACTIAQNGKKALQYLLSESTTPELIFLDLNMPVMNGYQFLHCLFKEKKYETFAYIPVVVLTTSHYEAEKCKEAGAAFYLIKPQTCDQLFFTLSTVLTHDVLNDTVNLRKLIKAQANNEQESA
jgi:CheY-like chemotaxis protein